MRDLTKTEQKLIEALIDNDSTQSGLRLGDVLTKVYPIEYIEKNQSNKPFYQKTIKICHRAEDGLEAKIYEAFSLIIMLIEQRYIVAKELVENDIIGEKDPYCNTTENRHERRTYYNYYNTDLWSLLNSQYAVTNSLIDFAKDFKTVEQRRFEEQLNEAKESTCWSRIAALGAIITLIFTLCQTCCNDKSQAEQINSVVTAIKEHKTVTIDSIKTLPNDTLNVKVIQQKAKPAPQPQKKNPVKEQVPTIPNKY